MSFSSATERLPSQRPARVSELTGSSGDRPLWTPGRRSLSPSSFQPPACQYLPYYRPTVPPLVVPERGDARLDRPATLADSVGQEPACASYGEPGWACSPVCIAAPSPSPSGRMVGVSRCRSKTSGWSTYPSSVYFALLSLALSAYSYSLPAPGGRMDEGTSARDASPIDQNPRRSGEGFLMARPTADRPAGRRRSESEDRKGRSDGHERGRRTHHCA